ncbi:hypothetical protein SAMN04488564_108268 [Lentzea waywayandensis]|uniref:Uncharacterized protein n=1 Tax=Lentzea waywayandensis TaxID=84724 RepID=A0A1I6F5B8_9PSEU|nr:hypothetical protein [Lentzea waywayandensis]SFR25219.1 hypothetical protein SAMN04488564_108268 [Lentzea waywayandensis]
MTTPPVPPDEREHAAAPDGSSEPANVWAPRTPANVWAPRPQATPFPAYPVGAYPTPAPASPPQRTSRVGLVVGISLGVLLVAMMATVFSVLPGGRGIGTAVGDCVRLTGLETDMKYDEVPCGGTRHNYTVSKVLGSESEECGDDPDAYTTYYGREGDLCLIPVFFDGQCYDFTLASFTAENKAVDCGASEAIKVRVLANTADEAACGANTLKAMAYQETKTTYCFTPAS